MFLKHQKDDALFSKMTVIDIQKFAPEIENKQDMLELKNEIEMYMKNLEDSK